MNKYINFEDNIFILNTRIKMIADLLMLDADADIFLEKTIEDLDFTANTLNLILDELKINKQLISRDEQLNNLYETIKRFQDIFFNMRREDCCFSVTKYPVLTNTINNLSVLCESQLEIVDKVMQEMGVNTIDSRVVSSDELSELLKDI